MNQTSLIEFPCYFPIKIIGVQTPTFFDEIKEITSQHFTDFKEESLVQKPSQQSNYLAITATVYVESQGMLDAYYQDLVKHPQVKMVL